MREKGWVKSYRKELDNPIVCKDADHFAVWNYLILIATHSEYDTLFGKKRITLKPGQLIVGRKMISSKFKISESKVQRILKTFESEHQIEQHINKCTGRLITILNWGKYQESEHHFEHHVNIIRTSSGHHVNTKQEDKELKNVIINKIHAETFINIWNENFNSKINKKQFNQSINQLSNYSFDEIFSVLVKATKSDYLLGLTDKNKRGLTLHFFTNPDNFKKIKNGKYDNYNENKSKKQNNNMLIGDGRMTKAELDAFIEKKLNKKLNGGNNE